MKPPSSERTLLFAAMRSAAEKAHEKAVHHDSAKTVMFIFSQELRKLVKNSESVDQMMEDASRAAEGSHDDQ